MIHPFTYVANRAKKEIRKIAKIRSFFPHFLCLTLPYQKSRVHPVRDLCNIVKLLNVIAIGIYDGQMSYVPTRKIKGEERYRSAPAMLL